METFSKNFAFKLTFVFILSSVSANANAYPCQRYLNQVRENIRENWVGPRLFTPEGKLSRWVKVPPYLIASTIAFGVLLHKGDNEAIRQDYIGIQNAVDADIYGSDTVAAWLIAKVVTPNGAREIQNRAFNLFKEGLIPLKDRRDDFVRFGWWNSKATELANEILRALEGQAAELIVRKDLIKRISSHPKFPELAAELGLDYNFTLDLWLTPKINYRGKSDVEWFSYIFDSSRDKNLNEQQRNGLESIRLLYDLDKKHATFINMVQVIAKTLSDEEGMKKKLEKARQLDLSLDEFIVSRADLPFLKPEGPFEDELDRWKMLLSDSRFRAEATAWKEGKLSDFMTMLEFQKHWHMLSH